MACRWKPDSRDNRSLVFDGRLITADVDPDDFVFKNTPIMHGRTDMAKMLPGHMMQVIEDVSTDAVPNSLEQDPSSTSVKGAQRVAQLGQDAMEKILAATTQDICMPDRGFMIFHEMNMLYGDLFDAFVEKRKGWNFPTFFVTSCGSDSHADWWFHTKRELLKNKHLKGELQVAGFAVLPEEVPQDVMEQSPNPPQPGKMVISRGGGLCVPEEITTRWYHDPTFGSRFRAFLDDFIEESSCASLSSLF